MVLVFGTFGQMFTEMSANLSCSSVLPGLLIIDNRVPDGCTYADPWVFESLLGSDSLGGVDS